jgi:hypothetical protein
MELAMQKFVGTILVVIICLFCLSSSVQAQIEFKVLPGDMAVIGYRTDNHNFAIVCLREIPSGTNIRFTDKGWNHDETFRTDEGVIYWTTTEICELGMIKIINPLDYYVSGEFKLSTSGDQIFIYQELVADNPNFIFGLNTFDNVWQSSAGTATTSALPSDLKDSIPQSAIAIKHRTYSVYNGERGFNSINEAKLSIINTGNWTNITPQLPLPTGSFSFTTTAVHLSDFSAETGGESAPWWVLVGLVIIPILVLVVKRPKRNCCK